jgi:hypothetical protein
MGVMRNVENVLIRKSERRNYLADVGIGGMMF